MSCQVNILPVMLMYEKAMDELHANNVYNSKNSVKLGKLNRNIPTTYRQRPEQIQCELKEEGCQA